MIRPIVTDQLLLQQPAKRADKTDSYLAKDLRDTLTYHRKDCLGLAANMIGDIKAVIIVSLGFVDLVMFNPILLEKSQPYETRESCLSLTGSRVTQRYQEIKLAYYDEQWQEKQLKLTGLSAQICQHELDHLAGRLI